MEWIRLLKTNGAFSSHTVGTQHKVYMNFSKIDLEIQGIFALYLGSAYIELRMYRIARVCSLLREHEEEIEEYVVHE